MTPAAEPVVICGAGIAGISAAYWLSVRHGLPVCVIDERPPLTLTSDKSTEAYRNWWPGPDDAMVRLMNRSIDVLEGWAQATDNAFHLNRRGYVYATAEAARVPALRQQAEAIAGLGAGPVRVHPGSASAYQPAAADGLALNLDGADLLVDPALIAAHFPYLSPRTAAVLHVRRAGWFSAQQLGMWLWEQARAHGARLVAGRLTRVEVDDQGVCAVGLADGTRLATRRFVNAAGPFVAEVGRLLGVEVPVFHERHLKLNFTDALGVIPREAPMLIWDDAQTLVWPEEERAALAEAPETRWLTEPFPAGVHTRPDGPPGSPIRLMLWDYHRHPVAPVLPVEMDEFFPELVVRGLATMLPGLQAYLGRLPRPYVDGGYYTKTRENRLLAGPLPVPGAFVIGALSGYGVMAAPAAGELVAAHVAGAPLPDYAPAFALARYGDPAYAARWVAWDGGGQL